MSGAFHTPLMEAACHELRDVLNKVEIKMPSLTVYSNVTGRPYKTVDEIRESLVQQIVQPVLWQATLEAMLGAGVTKLYDMGPRQTIKVPIACFSALSPSFNRTRWPARCCYRWFG